MTYKSFRYTLNILLVSFGLLSFGSFIFGIAGGGVLNDLDAALIEIKDLEQRGLLLNPPKTTSSIAKREIKILGNSQAVEDYIKEVEELVNGTTIWILFFIGLFFLIAFLKIFSRKIYRSLCKSPFLEKRTED